VIEYTIFLHGLAQQQGEGHDRNKIWHKDSLGDDARTLNTRIVHTCAEKVCDTTLDDEEYD